MTFVLKRNDINIIKRNGNDKETVIFQDQRFLIRKPGIYTIEGPNQIGKSVLIKLIVGLSSSEYERFNFSNNLF